MLKAWLRTGLLRLTFGTLSRRQARTTLSPTYKVPNEDVKGSFLKELPAKMEDMKGLSTLSYTSPREAIAEKFHMSEELLEA